MQPRQPRKTAEFSNELRTGRGDREIKQSQELWSTTGTHSNGRPHRVAIERNWFE